jgi:hypothetical protein
MNVAELGLAIQVLRRNPDALEAMLRGLSEPWIKHTEAGGEWSVFDVLGHLIHGELTGWLPRARIILKHGPEAPFTPFDRFAQLNANRDKNIGQLLARFAALRRNNVAELESLKLTQAQLDLQGTHPELGLVTLGNLIAAWVVHDLNHISQITRAMARRYTTEVGPWREYLSILGDV